MATIQIPNFHSGTDDEFRDMKWDFGNPNIKQGFDLVAWTIQHERERGLPSFNQYFSHYTGIPKVSPRHTFEEFSSDPEKVQILKELYANPDEVDLTVGQYLDEDFFPGTSVPRSQLITSLFSLFRTGISDRFSPGYSVLKCLIVETPWDCHPANALEELFWQPAPSLKSKDGRWLSKFWIEELNLNDNGFSALWRLIHDNSNVKCVQKNPMFPVGYKLPIGQINDVVCKLSEFTTPPIKKNPLPSVIAVVAVSLVTLCLYLFCFRKKK